MKNKSLLLLPALLLLVLSCKSGASEKPVEDKKAEAVVYTDKETGFTINVPQGWPVTAQNKTDEEGLKSLITFAKNDYNNFEATSEPFQSEDEADHWQTTADTKLLIFENLESQGLDSDSTATTIETIDGIDFKTFSCVLYGDDGSEILNYSIYTAVINGYDFCAHLYSNSKENKAELMKAWKNVKFNR